MEIEDLKIGDVLVSIKHKEKLPIIATTSDGRVIARDVIDYVATDIIINQEYLRFYTLKPKDEYIQRFKVGKYNGEIVEVRNIKTHNWTLIYLKEVCVDTNYPFRDIYGTGWKYARPVPQDKRKFLDIKEW